MLVNSPQQVSRFRATPKPATPTATGELKELKKFAFKILSLTPGKMVNNFSTKTELAKLDKKQIVSQSTEAEF